MQRERVRGFSEFLMRGAGTHLQFRQVAFAHDDELEESTSSGLHCAPIPIWLAFRTVGGRQYFALRRPAPLCPWPRHIRLVGHEFTRHSGEALKDAIMAAVIDQAPETQARRSLDLVLSWFGLLNTPVDRSPIRFITITAENL